MAEKSQDAGSIPAASTILNEKPFGEYVEGLFHFQAKGCVDESAFHTDDFEDTTPGREIGYQLTNSKGLRKIESLQSRFRRFVVRRLGAGVCPGVAGLSS